MLAHICRVRIRPRSLAGSSAAESHLAAIFSVVNSRGNLASASAPLGDLTDIAVGPVSDLWFCDFASPASAAESEEFSAVLRAVGYEFVVVSLGALLAEVAPARALIATKHFNRR